jgi:D-threo-aldose 1-dehydrogenase
VLLLAGRYALLDQTALPSSCLCASGVAEASDRRSFNSGILATGVRNPARTPYFNYAPAPPEIIARAAAIEDLCLEYCVPLKAAALQCPLAHPAVDRVLAGVRSRAELDENLALAAHPIAPDFWRELRTRGLVAAGARCPASADDDRAKGSAARRRASPRLAHRPWRLWLAHAGARLDLP